MSAWTIDEVERFHGHLGPFVVLGYRMGQAAIDRLGAPRYFGPRVLSKAGTTPPVSCLNDGIQLGTGCTFGKGNIKAVEDGVPEAEFFWQDRRVRVRVKPEARKRFQTMVQELGEKEASRAAWDAPIEEVLEWLE
ncbi:MAG: formylmethanofuran dehydrogenase subunit E family protein [Bacillota bacterium]